MRQPVRLALAAILVSGLARTAAAGETKKPSALSPASVSAAQLEAKLTRPDLAVSLDGGWVFVVNSGDADYTGPVDVWVTCKEVKRIPVQQTPPDVQALAALRCGPSFPLGGNPSSGPLPSVQHTVVAKFPAGHGKTPVKGLGTGQVSGAGWIGWSLGLRKGTFDLEATVDPNHQVKNEVNTNNNSTSKTVTIP